MSCPIPAHKRRITFDDRTATITPPNAPERLLPWAFCFPNVLTWRAA
jgi:hypothetical protein